MTQDLVPELWELLQKLRKERADNDRAIARFLSAVEWGTAKPEDVRLYAERLGLASAGAFAEVFRPGVLPNDRLYFNIVNRTVRPVLEEDFHSVQDAANRVQKAADTAEGIGLNGVDAPLSEDRIRGIVNGASDAETLEDALRYLAEPVITFAQAAYDSWVKENAEFRHTSGMEPRIVRIMHGRGCLWCQRLAGVYRYEDVRYGSNVFRRHQRCRCTVTFENGRTRQDVWSKRVWQASPEELERRKTLGREIKRFSPEVLQNKNAGDTILSGEGIMQIGGIKTGNILETGASLETGAKKTEGWQERHADRYYDEVRNRAAYSDAKKIVANITGFTVEDIEDIRQHVFIREHPRDGRIARFDSDFYQAQAWQRLVEGKGIRPSDIVLLRHEQMESKIMRETGCNYEDAHEKANAVYNWFEVFLKEGM